MSKTYLVTISHDAGIFRLKITAATAEAAREMAIRAERCPSHAIVTVRAA